MSFWIIMIIIAAIVTTGWVIVERDRRRHGITKDWLGNEKVQHREGDDTEKQLLQSEVEELRERVKVLERIATDPSRRTAEEIENLRDE